MKRYKVDNSPKCAEYLLIQCLCRSFFIRFPCEAWGHADHANLTTSLAEILPVFTKFCLKIGVLTGVVLKVAVGGVLFESGAQIMSIW